MQTGYDGNDFTQFSLDNKHVDMRDEQEPGFCCATGGRGQEAVTLVTPPLGRVDDQLVVIEGEVAAASGVVVIDPHAL